MIFTVCRFLANVWLHHRLCSQMELTFFVLMKSSFQMLQLRIFQLSVNVHRKHTFSQKIVHVCANCNKSKRLLQEKSLFLKTILLFKCLFPSRKILRKKFLDMFASVKLVKWGTSCGWYFKENHWHFCVSEP